MEFELVGPITNVEISAVGAAIRILPYLRKGLATVRLPNGALRKVEWHWFEAHGIGKRDLKIKGYLD